MELIRCVSISRRCSWARAALPALPALAAGARLLHDYAALAARAARIGGRAARRGASPGDRVALVSRNAPSTSRRCSRAGGRARRGAGQQQAACEGARVRAGGQRCALGVRRCGLGAVRSRRPAGRRALERVVELGGPSTSAVRRDARTRPRRGRAGDARVAFLHQRHHRPAQGRRAHPREPAARWRRLPDRRRSVAPGDAILHPAPLSHGSGLYVMPHVLAARSTSCRNRAASTPTKIVELLERWDRARSSRRRRWCAARRGTRDRERAARSA